jgi:hypothetical protein
MNMSEDNMEFLDNFISYDEDFQTRPEKINNFDLCFDSPYSGDTDSTGLFANQFQAHHPDIFKMKDEYTDILSMSNGDTAKRNEPFKIIKTTQKEPSRSSSIDVKEEPEPSVSSKSKRIGKREKAKERTKTKKGSFLDNVDSKFIPEGFDDPNLDENTRKKMIQMIRNRVSAQTSRDKKKVYMQQLEEYRQKLANENHKLNSHNSKLMQDLKKLEEAYTRVVQENEELKKNTNFSCGHCGRYQSEVPSSEADQFSGESQLEENSDLSSPRVSRNSNFSRSFFSYAFAFATILSVVLTISISGNAGNNMLPGSTNMKLGRLLAVADNTTHNKILINAREDFKNSLTVPSSPASLIRDPKENMTKSIGGTKAKNAVVDLGFYKNKFLPKASQSVQNIQMIEEFSEKEGKSSTLFCPSGFEIVTAEEKQEIDNEGTIYVPNIEAAQYLQLILPKNSIRLAIRNENGSDFSAPVIANEEGDGALLELWCKVYYVRELASNI